MHKWNEQGEPEALIPAEVAAVDQMAAGFRALRAKLIDIHGQAKATVVAGVFDEAVSERVAGIQARLHEVMEREFGERGNRDAVFSFVMYLINDICELYERDARLAELINATGTHLNGVLMHLNQLADEIGMEEPDAQGT